MAFLVSSWFSNIQTMPADYVVPKDIRPGNPVRIGKEIPVINLGDDAQSNRADLIQQIIKASEEFGLFQVIGHGISEKLMFNAMDVGKEFFGLSAEEKQRFCDESAKFGQKGCRVYTSSGYFSTQDFKYWRDTLQHHIHPLEEYINSWPDKPTRYREIMGPYTAEITKLAMRIMNTIYEGLGLEVENIEKEFDKNDLAFSINHYPACPDPYSALGAGSHCDPNLITLLQQDVYGLQLFKDGQWIGVEPIPNAIVVNISLSLEVISNGKLRGGVHRVVTNSACSRTSLTAFVSSPYDCTIQPAKTLLSSPTNPPLYKAVKYKEFLEVTFANNSDYDAAIQYLKIKA